MTDTQQFRFLGISSSGAQKILGNFEKCLNDDSIKGIVLNIGAIQTTSYGGIGGLIYELREKILQCLTRKKITDQ